MARAPAGPSTGRTARVASSARPAATTVRRASMAVREGADMGSRAYGGRCGPATTEQTDRTGTIGTMPIADPTPRAVVVDGRTFERVPIRTPVLMPGDDMPTVIREHAGPFLKPGDTVVMSESAVAIMQGRARDWRTITPSRLARWMSARVIKTPWGTGLRSPYAMQYAIELTGVPRMLLAGIAHLVGRLLGKKGWFYLVAGLNARMMDAEHTMGIKEFYECCIPAPADP